MSKSVSAKLQESRKWLEKNSQSGLNVKLANSALANADKAVAEMEALKARVAELTRSKAAAVANLDAAMGRVKTEKRLKAKEARLQAKLAALAAAPA